MVLRGGYKAVALKIQEAAGELSANDTRTRLADAINDAHKGTGTWAYYIDHFGDGESGDVIYSCDNDTFRAPYSITATGGAAKCVIDMENAADVVPRTVYEEEQDEDDHYAAMEEAMRKDGTYTDLPLYERFIAKAERDSAESGSFAGKGKSFPILKPADVMAAVHAMGRAGSGNYSAATLKSRIISIAKAKGWMKHLPTGWQEGGESTTKESAETSLQSNAAALALLESACTVEPIQLREARADYEIKLIAPGKGSSAFYPAEVLKRDGPKVFKAGTHVYLNHPTAAEEAARPEGDVRNLAGVLSTEATYYESHAKGPGLYARMKVFADHAATVEEKAPHVGMSIRAAGVAESNTKREGLPVLKELTSAESVDVVTKAGAGGMILTEAARAANPTDEGGAADMDAAQLTKLQEALDSQAAINQRLLKRAIEGDARETARRILKDLTLQEAAKERVVESVLRDIPVKDDELDAETFTARVTEAAKTEGQYVAGLIGSGRVRGMGAPAPVITAQESARNKETAELRFRESVAAYMKIGLPEDAAKKAASRGEAA